MWCALSSSERHDLRLVGHPLPGCPAPLSLWPGQATRIARKGGHLPFGMCAATPEMRAAIWARDVLRLPIRIVFTSAAQRRHSAYPRWLISRMDASDRHDRAARRPLSPHVRARRRRMGWPRMCFTPAPDRAAVAWAALWDFGGARWASPRIGRVRPEKGTDLFVHAMRATVAPASARGTHSPRHRHGPRGSIRGS